VQPLPPGADQLPVQPAQLIPTPAEPQQPQPGGSDRQLRDRKPIDYNELNTGNKKGCKSLRQKAKSGGNQTGTWSILSAADLSTARKNVTMVNFLFLTAFVFQMQYSGAETKQPILIDSEFTQPEKMQLRFCLLGKYAATTFTSHIRVPFNYSNLLHLESKMDQRLDQFITDLDKYHFKVGDADLRTIHSTFQIYRQTPRTFSNYSTIFWPAFHTFILDNAGKGTLPHLWPQ
jgi:hypothetical protein